MITRRGLVAAAALSFATPSLSRAAEPSQQDIFFDKDIPVLGNPNGDVTIAEYFDYQCSFCKTYHPIVSKVVKDDGNVRLVMKDWPVFGPASVYAAQAVLASATLGRYRQAQDALLDLKGRMTPDAAAQAFNAVGLDMTAVTSAVNKNNKTISRVLDRNWLQAEALKFRGTPSFVIGKTLYPGALDEAALKAAIAKARSA